MTMNVYIWLVKQISHHSPVVMLSELPVSKAFNHCYISELNEYNPKLPPLLLTYLRLRLSTKLDHFMH